MAYDRLADAIIKHAKLIVAAWIVILLVAAVPAINAFGNMSYDMNEMGIESSESMEGLEIIGTYFPSSDADASSLPMLVVGYDNEEERLQALGVVQTLQNALDDGLFTYELEDGSVGDKIQSISLLMDTSTSNPQEDGSGIVVASFSYNPDWTGSVIDDTPVLRDQIDTALAESGVSDTLGIYLTGNPAVSYDMETGAMEDISHIDVFTVLMILILVGLFFRSFVTSAMPPVTMGVAFAVTMGLIYGLMYFMDIFFITEVMLLVSMMGAGCDYCIFILARYREERRDGKDHHDALHSAIKWAGESITISGASVIIGFGAMSICSFSMISTMGICLALGIVVALFAALTFIPALLEVVGDRIFWPTKMKEYHEGGKATKGWFAWCSRVGHAYFDRSSRFTLKHAKAIVVVAVLVTIPALYVTAESETSYDMTSSLMTGDSESGMQLLGEYADQGMIYPNYVVLQYDEPVATISPAVDPLGNVIEGSYTLTWTDQAGLSSSIADLGNRITGENGDDNIAEFTGPFMWQSLVSEAMGELGIVDNIGLIMSGTSIVNTAVQNASANEVLVLEAALPAVQQQYEYYISSGALDPQFASFGITLSEVYNSLAGNTEMQGNIRDAIIALSASGTLDYIVNDSLSLIGGDFNVNGTNTGDVTYLKLSASTHDAAMSPRSMQSISFMQGAVDEFVANNAGITATWVTGTAVVNVRHLRDHLRRVHADRDPGGHPDHHPAVLRDALVHHPVQIRGHHPDEHMLDPGRHAPAVRRRGHLADPAHPAGHLRANGMSNDEAIHHAVVHSGSVITICGLIMGGAFGTLMLSSMGMLQQFGFALCFAILCDALIVRTYIVPAVMHLLGDWNWKGPRFLMTKAEKAALDEKSE